jgi:hypothetical protein
MEIFEMECLSKYVLSCSQTGIYTSRHILTSESVAEFLLRSLQYPPESDLEASKTSLNSRLAIMASLQVQQHAACSFVQTVLY